MLSENMKELHDLLSSIPRENPRVFGYGARLSYLDTHFRGNSEILNQEVDDFAGTEALFLAEIKGRNFSQASEQRYG